MDGDCVSFRVRPRYRLTGSDGRRQRHHAVGDYRMATAIALRETNGLLTKYVRKQILAKNDDAQKLLFSSVAISRSSVRFENCPST